MPHEVLIDDGCHGSALDVLGGSEHPSLHLALDGAGTPKYGNDVLVFGVLGVRVKGPCVTPARLSQEKKKK